MLEAIFDTILLLLPLAVLLAVVLAMAGFAVFGVWGGGAGAVLGLVIGFALDIWVGERVDAAIKRRKWVATLLMLGALLAVVLIAIYTR